jgi:hypothetical protein
MNRLPRKDPTPKRCFFSILLLFHIYVCVFGTLFLLSISAAHINFRSRFFPDRYPGVGSSRFICFD